MTEQRPKDHTPRDITQEQGPSQYKRPTDAEISASFSVELPGALRGTAFFPPSADTGGSAQALRLASTDDQIELLSSEHGETKD